MIEVNLHEGKNPRTEEPMFYGMLAPVNHVSLKEIAAMASEDTTMTLTDAIAVLTSAIEKIKWHLSNGNSVRLGILGSFRPELRSRSAKRPEEFKAHNIEVINVVFTPSGTMGFKLDTKNPEVQIVINRPTENTDYNKPDWNS